MSAGLQSAREANLALTGVVFQSADALAAKKPFGGGWDERSDCAMDCACATKNGQTFTRYSYSWRAP